MTQCGFLSLKNLIIMVNGRFVCMTLCLCWWIEATLPYFCLFLLLISANTTIWNILVLFWVELSWVEYSCMSCMAGRAWASPARHFDMLSSKLLFPNAFLHLLHTISLWPTCNWYDIRGEETIYEKLVHMIPCTKCTKSKITSFLYAIEFILQFLLGNKNF